LFIIGIGMEKVSFTKMEHGTAAEYEFLERLESQYLAHLPRRLIAALRKLNASLPGYQISRLEHSLQGATRAHRAGEGLEFVMSVLFHDIGDELATYSHSEMAASILRPFVSEKMYWIVKHHGLFQMYYYAHHLGGNRNARDIHKEHIWYKDAVYFCHNYDQNCFDPEYDTESIEYFLPMIENFFTSPNVNDREGMA